MRMSRGRARAILLGLLALGALLRFQDLNWDDGHHLHPDERFISMVEEKVAFPKSAAEYFDSSRSSLDPYNKGEGSFVYGTFPLVLTKAIAPVFGRRGYDGAYLIGRALSGVFDLVTAWLVYRITRRFAHRRAALMAAGLSTFCVLGIQLSHFWAVDTFLTTFTAATLLGAVRIAQNRSGWAGNLMTGLALGLAAACKITALALLLPVGIALLVGALRDSRPIVARLAGTLPRLAAVLAAAAVSVRVFLPHIFRGPSPLSFRLDPRWIDDLNRLRALSGSVAGFPPALQWAGRTILFPIENLVLWGAGVFFGIAALAAVAWAAAVILRRKAFELAPILVYCLFLFGYHGLTLVKSIRYFYPAYPALAVLTGVLFSTLLTHSRLPRLARAVAVVVLAGTALWALAFTSIYRHTQTRVAATRWIYTHVPPGKAFGNETWDDGLPLPMPGYDPGQYAGPSMPLFDPDSAEKAEIVVRALQVSDWVAVTSGRVYVNVTRVPAIFPMSVAYYRALFDGSLGFERAGDFTSYPTLGPLRFPDDSAEETVHRLRPSARPALPQDGALLGAVREGAAAGGDPADAADDARLGEVAALAAPRRRPGPPGPARGNGAERGRRAGGRELGRGGDRMVPGARTRRPPRPAALLGGVPAPAGPRGRLRAGARPRRGHLSHDALRDVARRVERPSDRLLLPRGSRTRVPARPRARPARFLPVPAREPPDADPSAKRCSRPASFCFSDSGRSTPRSTGARSRWTSRS